MTKRDGVFQARRKGTCHGIQPVARMGKRGMNNDGENKPGCGYWPGGAAESPSAQYRFKRKGGGCTRGVAAAGPTARWLHPPGIAGAVRQRRLFTIGVDG